MKFLEKRMIFIKAKHIFMETTIFLEKHYGAKNFDYVGDSRADLPVWNKARRVITSDIGPILRKKTSKIYPNIKHMNHSKLKILSYITALRPYQWVKNVLIFLPAIASTQTFSTTPFEVAGT